MTVQTGGQVGHSLNHKLGCFLTVSSDLGGQKAAETVGPVAQLAEPPAHNRQVPGSSPGGPTK